MYPKLQPAKKVWANPEIVLISTDTIHAKHSAGHENTVGLTPGGKYTNGSQFGHVFNPTGNSTRFVNRSSFLS